MGKKIKDNKNKTKVRKKIKYTNIHLKANNKKGNYNSTFFWLFHRF